MKTLLWKEFKEIRWLWLTVFTAILLIILFNSDDIKYGQYFGVAFFILLLYSAFLGARAFAGEREHGTFTYLHTRPLHPLITLWVKFFCGLFQNASLVLLIIISTDLGNQFYPQPDSPWIFLFYIFGIYTLCFWISMLVNDTVRAFLIGLPGTFLTFQLFIYFQRFNAYLTYHTFEIFEGGVSRYLKDGFFFLTMEIFLIGIIGVTYYSLLRKRLVWKTGFILFFPLALYSMHYSNLLFYGNILPVSSSPDIQFNVSENYRMKSFCYANGKVYGLDGNLYKNPELKVVDISNPNHPVEKTVMRFPGTIAYPYFDLENNSLYTLSHLWTGPASQEYLRTLGKNSTEWLRQHQPNNPRLDVYDIADLDHIKQIASIKFVSETARVPFYQSYDPIWIDKQFINIAYNIETASQYVDSKRGIRTSNITGGTGDYWKKCVVQIDKQSLQIVKDLDIYPNHTSGLYNMQNYPSNWAVHGDYYYTTNTQNALEINKGHRVSVIPWDWIDRSQAKASFNNMPGYYNVPTNIVIQNNRALVFYERGFIVFDITSPAKPKQLGKMTSDRLQAFTLGDGYLYTQSQARGFSIYRIP